MMEAHWTKLMEDAAANPMLRDLQGPHSGNTILMMNVCNIIGPLKPPPRPDERLEAARQDTCTLTRAAATCRTRQLM